MTGLGMPYASGRAATAWPDLSWSAEVERAAAPLYEKVARVVPPVEWRVFAPLILAINALKAERGAVILAHSYQTPEIYHCVADIVGDSLQLARQAAEVEADILVQCGVHFMAETAKLLNPTKRVLCPDPGAGCSLAASITAADVRALRRRYPGVPIVAYVNTSAAVKAEVDLCCTSSNAVTVVESLGAPRVIVVPDRYLAAYVASQTTIEIIAWPGACEVHERFTGEDIARYREGDGDLRIIAHPECPPDVIAASDFTGSTSAMIAWVRANRPRRVALITECSMADNLAAEMPETDFVRPCNLCPHMKKITLTKILACLRTLGGEITIDPAVAEGARQSVRRMIDLGS